ncbi:IS1182 family transposase [Trueperella pyogenes]|uniref:IS1182 family transposase n=1 Tax=Trueperella pyogenes TaxID=1661 RepID=UPI001F5089C0|nr:IS1182 family transposase [Trueperella pyogenes]
MDKRFRPVFQHQPMLLPLDIEQLIDQDALVRVVDGIVDHIDRELIDGLYPGGGAPAYDPVMMLKLVMYCYASGIYSSRQIAQATKKDLHAMWLTGLQPISHNTINRFRSSRIEPVFEQIFTQVVQLLADRGYIDLSTYFLDGTKIEANANKYSFVWSKSTVRYKTNLQTKIHAHLAAINQLDANEENGGQLQPEHIDSKVLKEVGQRISQRLADNPKDKALKQTNRLIEKEWGPKLAKYETQEKIAGSRGSYSKTDPDATFMRMKDDHMGNGQLKAAYNIQVGTSGQFIIDATVHQRPGDTAYMIDHCEHLQQAMGKLPPIVVADAGYGSEQNYAYLEERNVLALVKHNEFYRLTTNKKWREDPFRVANWPYDQASDTYTCPNNQTLAFDHERTTATALGYPSTARFYLCRSCQGCPLRAKCIRSDNPKTCRRITINPSAQAYKDKATQALRTEEGKRLRKQRSTDVETVFRDIKRNYHFTRFTLRSLKKAALEFRLVAIGHNIRKTHIANQNNKETNKK